MVAMDVGSFMTLDLGISMDRLVLGMVLGVIVLAVYQAVVLITALLATRSDAPPTARPSGAAGKGGGPAF